MATTDAKLDPELLAKVTALRHDIHQHPELGFKEHRTQKAIKEALVSAGVPEGAIKAIASTGLLVDVKGTAEAPADAEPRCVAFRADIDALPMPELSDLPYKSVHEGVAHACGHDGHVAIAAGAAMLLQSKAAELPSNLTVRFVFQPAEEGPGGAEPCIADGCMEGITDGMFGLHNINMLPLGAVWIQPGVASAHCADFDIVVTGLGGHGSSPHIALDPLSCAAAMVPALNSIVARKVSPFRKAVVNVCAMTSGTTHNVIPDTATLKGTMRDFNPETAALLQDQLRNVATHLAEMHDCKVDITISDSYPCIVNSPEPTEFITKLCEEHLGEGHVVGDVGGGMPGAEDFSYYLHHKPGCFIQMGGGTPETRCPVIHQSAYDFEDRMLPIGMMVWCRVVEQRFGVTVFPRDFFPPIPDVDPEGIASFRRMWG